MNFVLPPDVQRLLQERLRKGLGKSNYRGALNVLLACPELARDPVIHTLLEQVLLDPALGYRWYAARLLATLGEPLGPLHLVYNSLAVHPVLGRDHTKISGWHECALPFAHELDE